MDRFDQTVSARVGRLAEAVPRTQPPTFSPVRGLWAPALGGAVVVGFLIAAGTLGRLGIPPVATVNIFSLTLAVDGSADWNPTVAENTAEANALEKAEELTPSVRNLRIISVRQVAGVYSVTDTNGDRKFQSSEAVDAWVFQITGESTELATANGWALVDAHSGVVIAADMIQRSE
jgi:hypothetical protein